MYIDVKEQKKKCIILKRGTSRNNLELPRTNWNHLEKGGSTWNEMGSATKWHKKHEIRRKKLCAQYHCPMNTTLAIAIVTKSTISDVCRWNYLEFNGTRNEPTQKKTLIGQYCVYNIINLQNITLQKPIVANSSILAVGKVSQNRLCFIYILNKKVQLSMKIRLAPNH